MVQTSSPPSPAAERRFVVGCFVAAVLLNLWFSSVGWDHSLREPHEFRGTQTALSAWAIQQDGWRLDYPLPLFGPPWSAPFEFPFYQVMVAKLSSWTGMTLEHAGRTVSLLFFYLSLPAVFLAQQFLPIPRSRWLLLPAALLLSPVYVYYSRGFAIESVAFCACAWFLLAFGRTLHRFTWPGAAAAGLLGIVAGLAKSTTFAVFLVAGALLVFERLRAARREGRAPWRAPLLALALVVPGLAATASWTRYSDAVKAQNPLAASLQSAHLREFILGSPAARFNARIWSDIGGWIPATVMGTANAMLLVVFGILLAARRHWALGGLVLCFASGPLVFPHLYAIHDYYFYASGAFLVAALALAWSSLLDLGQFSRPAACGVIGLSLALQAGGYIRGYYQNQREPSPPPPELSLVLGAVTSPGDVVLMIGEDWNPMTAYFAGRRAIMVRDESMRHPERLAAVLDRLGPGDPVTALVVKGDHRKYPEVLAPITRRLGLQVDPLVMNAEAQVYVAARNASEAMLGIGRLPPGTFTLIDNTIENLNMPRHRFAAAALPDPRIRDIFGPALAEIVHPFNVAVYEIDGQPASDAHAPTDVVLALAPGHAELVMEFGILPAAWQAERPTDGIEFRVEYQPTEGRARVLFSQLIQPVPQPSDRKARRVTVPLPPGASGTLRLRTLPGPATSIACDYGYWRKVELR